MVYEKKADGVRYIKMSEWYVELIPEGAKEEGFKAKYYEKGLGKLCFSVKDTYIIDYRAKNETEKAIIKKLRAFLKVFREMDKVEKLEDSVLPK